MIPRSYITEWSNQVPWQSLEQVEQDLVICRALVAIFSDEWLASSLAFRGGTALHKLYLQPQPRYSEDIDLVQMRPEPIKETIQRLQSSLSFLGDSVVVQKANNNTLKFRFTSEFPPVQDLRLKVEINCREHFTVLGYQKIPFEVNSSWFSGSCSIATYHLEELLGTKLRALYQRKKGRDLFDLHQAWVRQPELNEDAVLQCYHAYMALADGEPPSQQSFLKNLEGKMRDDAFLRDTRALLRLTEVYDPLAAFEKVKSALINRMESTDPSLQSGA